MIRSALYFSLALGVVYLFGAFVMGDFNSMNWGVGVRVVAATLGFIVASVFAAAMYGGI